MDGVCKGFGEIHRQLQILSLFTKFHVYGRLDQVLGWISVHRVAYCQVNEVESKKVDQLKGNCLALLLVRTPGKFDENLPQ